MIYYYLIMFAFLNFVNLFELYVGNNGIENQQNGTLLYPFWDINYALKQNNDTYNKNIQICLLDNIKQNNISGSYIFHSSNISIMFVF